MAEWLGANKVRISFLAVVVANFLVWGFFLSLPDGKLHLKVYDVGQGDAIFLETASGSKILIDGGPDNKVINYLGKDLPFYSRKIDLLVLSHPEADHLTGLLEVVKRYQIKTLWISNVGNQTRLFEDWQRLLKEKKIPTTIVYQGDKMIFPDKTQVSVLWPRKDVQRSDLNSNSIVVEVSFGSFDAILAGDADQKSQPYTSDSRPVEVLKVPHHGSKTALNATFVSLIKPAVSIISVGAKNLYGHPSEEAINLLKSVGSKVYRTDKNGTVVVVSDGKNWYIISER